MLRRHLRWRRCERRQGAARPAAAAAPPMERAVPVAPSAVAAALPMDGAATAAPAAAAAACPASAVSTGGSKRGRVARRDTAVATGGGLGENVAWARCPGELAAGAGGTEALVESERVGKRAELGSRLLPCGLARRAPLPFRTP